MLKKTMKILTASLLVGAFASQVQAATPPHVGLDADVSSERVNFAELENRKNEGIKSAPGKLMFVHYRDYWHKHKPKPKKTITTSSGNNTGSIAPKETKSLISQ